MSWTAPRTWVAGEVVTAALLNTHLRDNLLMACAQLDSAAITVSYDKASLDQTFRHLLIAWQFRSSRAAVEDTPYLRFNNDSGSNYDYSYTETLGATVTGASTAGATLIDCGAVAGSSGSASKAGSGFLFVPDYAGTTYHKNVVGAGVSYYNTTTTNFRLRLLGGLYRSTSAISRVQMGAANGNATGRVSVYGLP